MLRHEMKVGDTVINIAASGIVVTKKKPGKGRATIIEENLSIVEIGEMQRVLALVVEDYNQMQRIKAQESNKAVEYSSGPDSNMTSNFKGQKSTLEQARVKPVKNDVPDEVAKAAARKKKADAKMAGIQVPGM